MKIEVESLQRVQLDPLTKFIEIMQRIARVTSQASLDKNDLKRYCVDVFNEKVIISSGNSPLLLKSELHKVSYIYLYYWSNIPVYFIINKHEEGKPHFY